MEHLLVAAGRGDPLAYAALYERLVPRIYGLVLGIVGDRHQSEEVTQEVALQLWQGAGGFDPERGSALAWTLMLAHRRAVDRVRASEASRRREQADLDRSHVPRRDVTVESAESASVARDVRASLAKLSAEQRCALELAYFGGYTHAEVSLLTKAPLGTAKTRIRQGLLELRELMTPVSSDPC